MSQVLLQQLIVARNLTLANGTLEKEGGAVKYNSVAVTAAPSILAGFDWWPTSVLQRMVIYTSLGDLLKDSGLGTFPVTLKSGLTPSSRSAMFVEGGAEVLANNKKLFFFNSADPVQVLAADGVVTADLTTPPADWATIKPASGAIHERRLWGFAGHTAYYSIPTNHEDFTAAGSGSIAVYPGVGDEILGGISFKGLLIIFKYPVGIYAIDTSDTDITKWRVIKINQGIGIASPTGFVQIDDDVLFIDPQGSINLISGITEFGSVKTASISSLVALQVFVKDNLNRAQLKLAQAIYYTDKKEVHIAVPASTTTVNNRRLIVDFNEKVPRFLFSDRDVCPSIWLRKDTDTVQRPVIGDATGFVWRLDQDSKNKAGVGYSAEFQSGYSDLSHVDPTLATKRKNAQFLEVVVEPTGNWDLLVDMYWDGDYTETVSIFMGPSGVTLGTFLLGTDSLGASTIKSRRVPVHGGGRRVSIAGRNSGMSEDFSVGTFYLEFNVSDEKATP